MMITMEKGKGKKQKPNVTTFPSPTTEESFDSVCDKGKEDSLPIGRLSNHYIRYLAIESTKKGDYYSSDIIVHVLTNYLRKNPFTTHDLLNAEIQFLHAEGISHTNLKIKPYWKNIHKMGHLFRIERCGRQYKIFTVS